MCDWNHNWTGSTTTPQCEAPATHSTASGHRFCDLHFGEHEADMVFGLGVRVIRDGDAYLADHALASIDRLRKVLDSLELEMLEASLKEAAK